MSVREYLGGSFTINTNSTSMIYNLEFIYVSFTTLDNADCFFFKLKTAYGMRISDWSSDVCSADLGGRERRDRRRYRCDAVARRLSATGVLARFQHQGRSLGSVRSRRRHGRGDVADQATQRHG